MEIAKLQMGLSLAKKIGSRATITGKKIQTHKMFFSNQIQVWEPVGAANLFSSNFGQKYRLSWENIGCQQFNQN